MDEVFVQQDLLLGSVERLPFGAGLAAFKDETFEKVVRESRVYVVLKIVLAAFLDLFRGLQEVDTLVDL